VSYPFLLGHGTQNDFVLLPDHDNTVHGRLSRDAWADRVRALCHRRAGLGGDGVLRVVRTKYVDPSQAGEAQWFMDYWNADGSVSEMCGNGIRVFARHLLLEGLVEPGAPVPVATRDGVKTISFTGAAGEDSSEVTVDMGTPKVLGTSAVTIGSSTWQARHVDVGNPHAVAFLDDGVGLEASGPVGPLTEEPSYDAGVYPHGVNIEFVQPLGPGHVAMRVHERGSGETRSCGTGACAVAVAVAVREGLRGRGEDVTCRVDLPGGTLTITWTTDDRLLMTGPAVLVAAGQTDL